MQSASEFHKASRMPSTSSVGEFLSLAYGLAGTSSFISEAFSLRQAHLEEGPENVGLGSSAAHNGQEDGEAPVENCNPQAGQGLSGALIAGTLRVHEGVGDEGGVVDRDADGQQHVNGSHGIEGQVQIMEGAHKFYVHAYDLGKGCKNMRERNKERP